MADHVCGPIFEKVKAGEFSPEEGLEAIMVSALNQTPELRPDPLDPDFWAAIGYCIAMTAKDVAEVSLKVAVVAARLAALIP